MACGPTFSFPLLLIDNHLPYPAAILQVFGVIRHRRRQHGRGRRKHPDLKPPPGLLTGVVEKRRDPWGHLLGVRTRALFGPRLADQAWTVQRYVEYAVHVSDLEHQLCDEARRAWLTSALETRKRKKLLPTS